MYLYSYSKDAKSGRNKPTLIADILSGRDDTKNKQYETFRTPEEYERRRQEIIRGK